MACDLRVASRSARFAITPAKIGISYPQEDVHRLVELVGPGQAARFLFTALGVDGFEAYELGLVEWLEPEGGADAVAAAILGNSSESLAALKRAIRLAAGGCRIDAGQDRQFDTLDRRRRAGATARSAAAEMIGERITTNRHSGESRNP